MPDNKNNDVINDILNQLDNEKKKTEAESRGQNLWKLYTDVREQGCKIYPHKI